MKNIVTFFFLAFIVQQVNASSFYDQLCRFNANWGKYSDQAPRNGARVFNTDQEYIRAHLKSVITILKNNPTGHLNDDQYNSRIHLIKILEHYKKEGNFPINNKFQKRTPVFIDDFGTHCAVAFLLKETGKGQLAKDIEMTNNYAWLKDVDHPDLTNWQVSSGLSLEELKLIQGAYEFYMPNARIVANRYQIPQKPETVRLYFEESENDKKSSNPEKLWCYGEGKNGVLHGIWIQNYSEGIPWIEGYYENGNRTGQWKEYYQGTNQLCRTENWRNDKLNGVRKRFDRNGKLIEEILFKNGKAVTKTNYDFSNSLEWVRRPIDSVLMDTEVYTFGGALIAYGQEKVHNPGNLLWFQNIELTALNSAAISSRNIQISAGNEPSGALSVGNGPRLFSNPQLVKYKKEGEWLYFKDRISHRMSRNIPINFRENLRTDYAHFGASLYQTVYMFSDLNTTSSFDSLRLHYRNGDMEHFRAYNNNECLHLVASYYKDEIPLESKLERHFRYLPYNSTRNVTSLQLKCIGQLNKEDDKIGSWKYFDRRNRLYKIENFIIPGKEEEEQIISLYSATRIRTDVE